MFKLPNSGTGKADGNQGGGAGSLGKGGKVGLWGEVVEERGRVGGGCASSPKSAPPLKRGAIIGLSYMKEGLVRALGEIAKKGWRTSESGL